ncbi:hypothetical protein EVAR_61130_1 [Eumeta japonica]|uniref:Uncharacterized protein n=1 Tax=Eumeta variegata TaxID=151549 RepID=A0A4C2AE00_EUMVA|nr:hypothetical protein EVAR_61130_1 [Eumeta japonica]
MRSNPNNAQPCFRNDLGDVAPSFMGQRVIGLRAGQYLREDLGLKMLTSPSLPFFTSVSPLQRDHLPPGRAEDRVVASVPRLTVPPLRQGRSG